MYSRLTRNDRRPEIHEGSNRQFLDKYKLTVSRAFADSEIDTLYPDLLNFVADTRNLRAAWDHLACCGGHAPGPDGLTYGDFLDHDIWDLLRVLRSAILEHRYCPGPTRRVPTSKGQGRGTRMLTLQNIQDRVVQRAILQVIEPILDPGFDAYSFGGRTGRGPLKALATAARLFRTQQRTVWITEDLRDAFNHVPLARLMQVFQKRLPCEAVIELVDSLIDSDTGKGLAQGAPLSPLLMNLYLDHFFDTPWRRRSHPPTIRFIDDLLILCGPSDEPAEAYEALTALMSSAGMHLKGAWPDCVVKSGDTVKWLGYQLRSEADGLRIDLDQDGWFSDLHDDLMLAHVKPEPALRAHRMILGKLSYAGPAYPACDIDRFYDRLLSTCAGVGFEEIPTLKEVTQDWEKSYVRWLHELRRLEWASAGPKPLLRDSLGANEAPF